MTDEPEKPASELSADGAGSQGSTPEQQTANWVPPAPRAQPSSGAIVVAERPELAVGAAFAGGLLAALILKRLAR